jgi:hypothetical protein
MNWTLYLWTWLALAIGIGGLALYRRHFANAEDDTIHLSGDPSAIARQAAIDAKLAKIDRWGKILTAVVAVLGLALLGAYGYAGWEAGNHIAG